MSSSAVVKPSDLYKASNRTVWIVRVGSTVFAGVCVDEKGFILTTSHWKKNSPIQKARRVDGGNFYDFELVEETTDWGICLIRVKEADNVKFPFSRFGSGILHDGNKLYSFGHPMRLFGTFMAGYVSYPCVENPPVPVENSMLCHDYDYAPIAFTFNLPYRVAGQFWNMNNNPSLSLFEKQIQCQLPVIQCGGMQFDKGCVGAPIFEKTNGYLVGLAIGTKHGYGVGVHVSLIHQFTNKALEGE